MTKDIRLSIGFLDHPKTIKIQRMLGSDGVLSLVRLWAFAAQYKPDGVLSGMDADDIEIASKWNGMQGALLTALLTHKWVDEKTDENGLKTYLLHDWEDHQGYVCHSEDRSKQAKRAAETRWKNKDKCSPNADSIDGAMLKDAKRNAPSPNPYPLPSPEPKEEKKKEIEKDPSTEKVKTEYSEEFMNWFAEYPVKVAKQKAFEVWKKIKPDPQVLHLRLSIQKKQREQGKAQNIFIPEWPNPTTYLNQARWEDDFAAQLGKQADKPLFGLSPEAEAQIKEREEYEAKLKREREANID